MKVRTTTHTNNFCYSFITLFSGQSFNNVKYFDTTPYGASLQSLMWCVSLPTVFLGLTTMTAVRYWASLTTNRKLLGSLIRIYVAVFALIFLFTLWCTCVLFLTFSGIRDWGVSGMQHHNVHSPFLTALYCRGCRRR